MNMLNMQHIIQNSKDEIIQSSPVVAKSRLKDPPTWLKVATTLEKPQPPLTIIVSDNGLPPGRRQAIIWTNAEILL